MTTIIATAPGVILTEHPGEIPDMIAAIDKDWLAEHDKEVLLEALKFTYGWQHVPDCESGPGHEGCTCGLVEWLERLPERGA